METTDALRWATYYRALATLSFVVGAGIATIGIWLGFGDALLYEIGSSSAYDTRGAALDAGSPLLGGVLAFVGFVTWQMGKTTAFFWTVTTAVGAEADDAFDTEAVKSELLAALNNQLSDVHSEVETTRKRIDRLSREEHADAFDPQGSSDSQRGQTTTAQNGGGNRTSTSNGHER